MDRAVVVLSGGMDSGVMLADFSSKTHVVGALFFDYGSRHNAREGACAELLAKRYGVPLQRVEMPFIGKLFNSSLLASSDQDIPEGHYQEESMKSTVVPFRNGIMLSVAAGYAESVDADLVLIGSHSGDHAVYPDCRPEFNQYMAEAAWHGTYNHVRLLAPYANISKGEIASIGYELEFPFQETWTCYKGLDLHCGKCGACVERKEALALDGFVDPTSYEA